MTALPHWLKFKVRTLDAAGLKRAAEELAAMAQSFQPDMLLGIRSGGYTVAELMARQWPQATLLPMTCRRASTERKQKSPFIKKLLFSLPRVVNDRLRIMEHIALTQLRPPKPGVFIPDAGELSAIDAWLRQRGTAANILIVDDAVDSGATLAAVHKAIRGIADPTCAIKTAVITVTTDSPLLQPDFTLYRYVLCRFPWSLDSKN